MLMPSRVKAHYRHLTPVCLTLFCLSFIGGCSNGSAHANSQHSSTAARSSARAHSTPGVGTALPGRVTKEWAHVNTSGEVIASLNYDANQKILIEATELSKAMSDVDYTQHCHNGSQSV